jgi:D-alanyl-D-alanine carboxypeptidase
MTKLLPILLVILILSCESSVGVPDPEPNHESNRTEAMQIDSILQKHAFNGVVMLTKDGNVLYHEAFGYSNLEERIRMELNDQFVIGSISKQISAVMVLKAYENGLLQLDASIDTYLKNIPQSWSKHVTVHQLLTHTHGIVELDQPLEFEPGTQFSYSQIGFELLAKILEKVHGKNFETIATEFFAQIGLNNTFHPENKKYEHLVKGYASEGKRKLESTESSEKPYVAAGGFISTAPDLTRWNSLLYGGKILKPETLELMKTAHATRDHPLFGMVEYGYGILFKKDQEEIQIGATGYTPGYVSACFFFPRNGYNLIILANTAHHVEDLSKTFSAHLELLKFVNKY